MASTRIDWELDSSTWLECLEQCQGGTFFHSPAWYRARGGAQRIESARITFSDGVIALMPLAVRPQFRGLVREAVSGLENGYGGLVATQPLSEAHAREAYRLITRRYPNVLVVGNPHNPAPHLPAGGLSVADGTQAVPVLAPEAQRAAMAGMRQRGLKKAQKSGFRVTVSRGLSEAETRAIYALYARHAAQWTYTKWVRDLAYFEGLAREAGEHLVLVAAYHDDELAGFHLLGCHGRLAIQLHLATDSAFDKANVGTLLIADALAWCHQAGYTTFDFLPSGQLEGVRAYKASFGAQFLPHATVRQCGLVSQALGLVRALAAPRARPDLAPSV